jgi:DNA-binding phage protein
VPVARSENPNAQRENPEFVAEYLRATQEDDDVLLIGLRRLAEARGGIAKVAKARGLSA